MGAKLGQHFLIDKNTALTMARAAVIPNVPVLEVGPGKGILTQALLTLPAQYVVAIEKDKNLCAFLKKNFREDVKQKRLIILEGDARDLLKNPVTHQTLGKKYTVAANIPYYITGIFFRLLFSQQHLPARAVIMVQKEVAKRIIGDKGKESILSLSVKAYARPTLLCAVPKSLFLPPPTVDSAVILCEDISRRRFKKLPEKEFFSLIKRGFAHKRKRLSSQISLTPDLQKKCGVHHNARAEELTLDQWLCLTKNIKK